MKLIEKIKNYKGMNPTLLGAVSLYLIYLGGSLLANYNKLGKDKTVLSVGAIVFIVIGAFNLYRAVMQDKKYHNGILTKLGVFTIPEEELGYDKDEAAVNADGARVDEASNGAEENAAAATPGENGASGNGGQSGSEF